MLSRVRDLLSKLSAPHVATDSSPGHGYSLARHQALAYDREIIAALAPFPEPSPDAPAWGVVMEIAYPGFSGTLAAFSNGQASLYNSDGLGVPNEHNEQIQQANAKLIAAANKAIPYLKPSATYPLPAPWHALFYVRTDSGNLITEATGKDFRDENHPLFSLFTAGNELLTELKLVWAADRKNDLLKRIAGLNDAIAQRPADVELYARRAEDYMELGEFDKALVDFEKLLLLMPVADGFLARGSWYSRRGDHTSALADYDRAIELEPTNAMAYSNRASVYSQLQDMEKALANYELAIQNNPGYANSYTNRAFAYYKLGRYEDGVADCNRALALRPDHPYTYSNRGLCRAALGDKEGARADFQRALTLESPPPAIVIEEALSGLHALDHPGEPMPVWRSPSVWVTPSEL
jgi:tetratricopeptide (TPR) repeat protein